MNSKKTICFVLPVHSSHTIGGAQYQAECLMNHIIELEKFNVYYITNLADANYHPVKYSLIHLDTNYQKKTILSLIRSSSRLKDLLNKVQPDIIYQRIGCYQTAVCSYYAKKSNCMTLFHIASDKDVMPIHYSVGRNFLFQFFDRRMIKYGIRNASRIIAQTNHQAAALKKWFNKTADAVVYNFHPIPTNPIQKQEHFQIIWIANLKKNKQPEKFIQLAKDLHPKTGANFIMIGKMQGSANWCRRIQNQINQTEGLEYLGFIPQDDVNDLLNRSHLLVNTSNFEGFSNTFIQAWMRKVPVVSLHVDPDNLLEKKKIGRLSGKYEKMRQDVMELIGNETLRESLADNAYAYSTKYHSFENIQQIMDLIED